MYKLDDGTIGSRSAYIRQEFRKNRSRQDIANELEISYNSVYAATMNMSNDSTVKPMHPNLHILKVPRVNCNFNYVNKEGNECSYEDSEFIKAVDLIYELFAFGISRKEIADYFDVSYNVIYGLTRDHPDAPRQDYKKKIILDSGHEVYRVDYIRELYREGMSRKEIATHLTFLTNELVDYTTVWLATKDMASEF